MRITQTPTVSSRRASNAGQPLVNGEGSNGSTNGNDGGINNNKPFAGLSENNNVKNMTIDTNTERVVPTCEKLEQGIETFRRHSRANINGDVSPGACSDKENQNEAVRESTNSIIEEDDAEQEAKLLSPGHVRNMIALFSGARISASPRRQRTVSACYKACFKTPTKDPGPSGGDIGASPKLENGNIFKIFHNTCIISVIIEISAEHGMWVAGQGPFFLTFTQI